MGRWSEDEEKDETENLKPEGEERAESGGEF
jgi:hypothetical protein